MILTLHGVRDMHDPCFCLCGPESPAATYGIAWENFNLKTVASHTCREGEPETARWWKSQPWTEQGPSVHVRCPNHFCGSCTAGKGACALFLCRDQQLLQEGAVVLQVLHTSRLVMHTALQLSLWPQHAGMRPTTGTQNVNQTLESAVCTA